MKSFFYVFASITILIFVVLSCKTVENATPKSSQKDISAITISGIAGATSDFVQATNTYTFTVSAGTNTKALALTFTLPNGATASPASGSTQDFTNPVTYTITAEDGTTIKYTVKIVVQTSVKSSAKQILSFSFEELNPVVKATINQSTFEITAEVAATANLKALKPTITLSDKATVSPATGVSQDFTNAVKYTVTAENGSRQEYFIKVSSNTLNVPIGEIHISGFEHSKGINYKSLYWKNESKFILENNDGEYGGEGLCISGNENDIYVGGTSSKNNNVSGVSWKNGLINRTILSNIADKESSYVKSIFVSGNNVYVSGSVLKESTNVGIYFYAFYEIDNKSFILSKDFKSSGANCIYVSGNDVYVGGYEKNLKIPNDPAKGVYWKNGTPYYLEPYSTVYSIFVMNNDIYCCGTCKNSAGVFTPCYWKNGVLSFLSSKNGDAFSIYIDGSNVYIAGYEISTPVYWKNGALVKLQQNDSAANANSIFVKNNNIYIAGKDGYNACYWVNGIQKMLSNYTLFSEMSSSATGIFVR